ncbi:hypothetical protein PIB30_066021 [Stylosanthes scabra]|uniref:Uncharacterized protein n=1 Tax=Stylosanthes scabra TaxID=79078 RepID=A0ABU6ZKY7_9FABA|nr:hypothetical protein [Stylosanthes scabra]
MAKQRDEETHQQGRDVSRGEVWIMTHRKINGSYIHEDAQERIMDTEQHDESSRVLSQNDSLAQVLEKEHLGRVRRIGFGLILSRLFGQNSQQTGEGAQTHTTRNAPDIGGFFFLIFATFNVTGGFTC